MKDNHEWFYEELKEIPRRVYEKIPIKNFHCRCVAIPIEKKKKITDIVDVKVTFHNKQCKPFTEDEEIVELEETDGILFMEKVIETAIFKMLKEQDPKKIPM